MRFYLKGYYGYKNLGDEFLLLGLLSRLVGTTEKQGKIEHLVIETKNLERLTQRLSENQKYFGIPMESITIVGPTNKFMYDSKYIKLFGGGEVISDARPFPYNGRNYLGNFFITIFFQHFWILGGVGTEKKWGTKWLYKQLLGRTDRIVVREKTSFEVAKKYSNRVELYHDYCLDLLDKIGPLEKSSDKKDQAGQPKNILINVNKYIRNETTEKSISELAIKFPGANFRFLPAEIGSDDLLFPLIQAVIPTIKQYDRTEYTVEETCAFIAKLDYGLAARLHVLLLLKYFNVPFSPLAYQEKVTKMLSDTTN